MIRLIFLLTLFVSASIAQAQSLGADLSRLGMPAPQASYVEENMPASPQAGRYDLLFFYVDISAGAATNSSGVLTPVRNGVGDMTFTLDTAGTGDILFLGGGCVGEGFLRISGTPTSSVLRLIVEDDAGTASDFDYTFAIAVPR